MGLFGKSKKKPQPKGKAAPKAKAALKVKVKAKQVSAKPAKKTPTGKGASGAGGDESWLYQGDKEAMIRAALANVGNPLPEDTPFPDTQAARPAPSPPARPPSSSSASAAPFVPLVPPEAGRSPERTKLIEQALLIRRAKQDVMADIDDETRERFSQAVMTKMTPKKKK